MNNQWNADERPSSSRLRTCAFCATATISKISIAVEDRSGPTVGKQDLEMAELNNILESYLDEHDVARITKISLASVRRRRLLKQDPPFVKIGSSVRYPPREFRSWLESLRAGDRRSAEVAGSAR